MYHKIRSAAPLPEHRLLVSFADGCSRLYDLTPLFARVPALAPLRDVPGLFERVRVDPGGYGVSWTGDLDLSAEEIYVNGQPRG